ncbi:MAG: hypothetical protein H8E32_14110 [Nitrospinae bacterium]|nr:hypothetical protein [Nitrospinota bacterium]
MSNSSDINLSVLQGIPSKFPRKWRFLSEIDSTNAEISRSLANQPPEEG